MSETSGYSPDELPDSTALRIKWDPDFTGSAQDLDAVGVVLGPYEWNSLKKRSELMWNEGGTEVYVEPARPEPGVMLETNGATVTTARLHLTAEQMRTLREHQAVFFTEGWDFQFDVTVVRRE